MKYRTVESGVEVGAAGAATKDRKRVEVDIAFSKVGVGFVEETSSSTTYSIPHKWLLTSKQFLYVVKRVLWTHCVTQNFSSC